MGVLNFPAASEEAAPPCAVAYRSSTIARPQILPTTTANSKPQSTTALIPATTPKPRWRHEAVVAEIEEDSSRLPGLRRRQVGFIPVDYIPSSESLSFSSTTVNGTATVIGTVIPISSVLAGATSTMDSLSSTGAAEASASPSSSTNPFNNGKSSSAQLIGGVVGGIFLLLIIIAFVYGSWKARRSVSLQRQLIDMRQRERGEMRIRSAERGLQREWAAERRGGRDSNNTLSSQGTGYGYGGGDGMESDMRELVGEVEDLPRYERCSAEDCPPCYTPPPPLTPLMPSTPERAYQPAERSRVSGHWTPLPDAPEYHEEEAQGEERRQSNDGSSLYDLDLTRPTHHYGVDNSEQRDTNR